MKISHLLGLFLLTSCLAACGGGSGGDGNNSSKPQSSASSSTAESSSEVSSSSSQAESSTSQAQSSTSSEQSSSLNQSSAASNMTSIQLTQQMGAGWNLGNTLEAIGSETAWGNPVATQELIDAIKAAGFKSIRIPVAWSRFSDVNNFVIETSWMERVEEVVNYALNADLYVVMNIHWDNGWMQPTNAQKDYVNNRLNIMWTQIATHFKNYDNRLLFAGTNEVMVDGDYDTPTAEYYTVQNSFNQTFVTAVRATGGNNNTRFLVVQGFNTNIDHTVNFAQMPTDSATDRLLMEVHYYDPFNFTLNENSNITQWGKNTIDPNKTETWANEDYMDAQFLKMKTHFIDQGIGVILGEFAAMARLNVPDHEPYRVYWNEMITKTAFKYGLVPMYWDAGFTGNFGSGLFNRNTGAQVYPDIIDVLVEPTQ